MKLKQNKGYVAVDMAVGLIILIMLIPMIIAMTLNISATNSSIKRKTQAVNIASNVIEIAKATISEDEYFWVIANEYVSEIAENVKDTYSSNDYTVDGDEATINVVINDVAYKIVFSMEDQNNSDENPTRNILANVDVTYKLGNKEKSVTLEANFVIE